MGHRSKEGRSCVFFVQQKHAKDTPLSFLDSETRYEGAKLGSRLEHIVREMPFQHHFWLFPEMEREE